MRNVAAAHPPISPIVEWTLPIIDPVEWHTAVPDYTKRMARMAAWCEEWMLRLS